MNQAVQIFISVCEESADVHAAALIRAAREQLPGAVFYGLTGPRMRALGVETVYDFASHAAMLSGVFGVVGRAWQALRAVARAWRARSPDLVILVDSPEMHLRIARTAKRLGFPVLYYVAPQTWAARAGRNRQIARDVDRLACILPFEEDYFRKVGVNAQYVGHPLFETLRAARPIPETVEFLRLRAAGRPLVALLPGSRRHVIDAMLPRQLDVVERLRAAGHAVHAAISCVSEQHRGEIRAILAAWHRDEGPGRARGVAGAGEQADAGIDIVIDDNASLLSAADLVLVASGTATLHVAYYRKPMVVMYDAGPLLGLLYPWLGHFVIKTPHLSLVNILADARVVPEFMPFVRDLGQVATVAGQLLTDETWRRIMVRQLDELVRPLEGSEASANVCRLMREMWAGSAGRAWRAARPPTF